VKNKSIEKSRLPLGKLLVRKRKLVASLEHIAHQYRQLECDKKALNVSEKWFDEREVEVRNMRQIMRTYHLANIRNSALIRFRSCREQINRWLQENTDQQEVLTARYWIYRLFSEVDNETYKRISSVPAPQQTPFGTDEGTFSHQSGSDRDLTVDESLQADVLPDEEVFNQRNRFDESEHELPMAQVILAKKSIAYLILYWKYTLKEKEGRINVELSYLQRLIDEKAQRRPLIRRLDQHLIENIHANQRPGLLSRLYSRLRRFESLEEDVDDEQTDLPLGFSFS
jgi:hypothetical protein